MRVLILIAGSAVLAVAVAPQTPIESIRPYRSWHLVTPEPIDMAPAIAMSCVGPSAWDNSPVNPHVRKLFRVFVNPRGRAAMTTLSRSADNRGTIPFPVGTMIVKEKYDAGKPDPNYLRRVLPEGAKPELLTVMVKRAPGYDAQNGNWEYLVTDGALRKIEGRNVTHCQACHRERARTDFVFGHYGQLLR